MIKNFSIKKSFSWEITSAIVGFGSTFLSSIILARILTPEEFGNAAICIAFVGIFNLLVEFGFTEGLIQTKELTNLQKSTVFFINITFGLIICLICFSSASLLLNFYYVDHLYKGTQILSIILIFNSLSISQISELSRNLDFKSLAIRNVISRICSSIAAIVLAMNGLGIYSLIYQEVIYSVLNCISLWIFSQWRPSLIFNISKVKEIISYSSYLFYSRFLSFGINKIDDLLIGKFFDSIILGYYGRSNSIFQLSSGISSRIINKFFFPLFSKLQTYEEEFNKLFSAIIGLVILISFLISWTIFLNSELIILKLFGKNWIESVYILEIISFKILFFPISSFMVMALLSKGLSKENFKYVVYKKVFRIMALIIGIMTSFKVFIIGIVISAIFGFIINCYFLKKLLKIKFSDYGISYFITCIAQASIIITVGKILNLDNYIGLLFPILFILFNHRKIINSLNEIKHTI